jgi:uncharacterized protein with HEPN domain
MSSSTSKRPVRFAIEDIIENIDAAQDFLGTLSVEAFTADRRTVYAVVRALEIISEASRRLPDDLKLRHPHLLWA